MQASKFIGKVLPDGRLSLPEEIARQVGMVFEVVLLPVNGNEVYSFTEGLAQEKGFSQYTGEDIERIIHESRGVIE